MRADGYHLIDAEMVSSTWPTSSRSPPATASRWWAAAPDVPVGRRQPGAPGPRALVGRHGARCGSRSASRPAPAWAAGRPTPPPCCAGRASTTSTLAARLGADVPFCLVGGRARVTRRSASGSSRCRLEALTFTLLTPPRALLHRRPSTGPGTTSAAPRRTAPTTSSRPPWWWPRSWPRGATGSATPPAQTPVLAGSGSHLVRGGRLPGPGRVVVRSLPAY